MKIIVFNALKIKTIDFLYSHFLFLFLVTKEGKSPDILYSHYNYETK